MKKGLTIFVFLFVLCLTSCLFNQEPIYHEVLFETNGGTMDVSAIQQIEEGTVIELPVPRKAGFEFAGWYMFPDFSGSSFSMYKSMRGVTFYAKYVKIHNITYVTQGGMHSNPMTILENESVSLTDAIKENEIFEGWYTDSQYINKVNSIEKPTSNITLYAKYRQKYTITYVLAGGAHSNPETIFANETITLTDVIKDNEFFGGWYTDPEYTHRVYVLENLTSNIILYARYLEKYNITYNLNGGVNDNGNPINFAGEIGTSLFNPSRPGFDFAGWIDENGNKLDSQVPPGTNHDVCVAATWTPATYSIKWDANGGTLTNNPQGYVYGVGINQSEFPVPSNDDKIFLYWYKVVNGVEERVESITTTTWGDVTLFAKWYDAVHSKNDLWYVKIDDTDLSSVNVSKTAEAYIIEIPEELKEYAERGLLHVKITATFTVKVRSSGNATATTTAYFIANGTQHETVEASAIGGGYPAGNIFGSFPKKGGWGTNQGTTTVECVVSKTADNISIACLYKMSSNKKSSTVTTDIECVCTSINYIFYLD